MAYEPKGKVKALIDAMRASKATQPVWNSMEASKVMETTTASLHAFLAPAIKHGVLFRKLENGRTQYSLTPLVCEEERVEPPPATPAPVPARRETTADGWRPPQMACTRPGAGALVAPASDLERQPEVRALMARAFEEGADAMEAAAVAAVKERQEQGGEFSSGPSGDYEEAGEVEPDAFVSCRTGEIVLVGLEPDEDGRVTVPADLVALIKRQIAWSPA